MVYTYSAAVLVTRGFTGPDRCRTTRGIKLKWVLCSVQWIPQTTQAPHPPDYRERGSFTTDGMAVNHIESLIFSGKSGVFFY